MELSYDAFKIKTKFLNMINYSYIVVDKESKNALVVDPSWEIDKIISRLEKENAKLTAILLTHSHSDHTNLVNPLTARFNTEVYMSQEEIDCYGFRCRNLQGLEDLEDIFINRTKVKCILTKGHSEGGMCYLLKNCVFTGDTLFSEGCGYCWNKDSAAEQMYESIQKLKYILSDDIIVYPGHSYGVEPGKTFGHLKMINVYMGFESKSRFVEFRNRKGKRGMLNFK
ncbi:glyoxylase-like metal-dependent hydrolase (beta-lactamase superfamily II) [Ruminiclostridium sufflavum DSM 19573]|uniref:Glyoxylase-like metal-dependent hydrolase (Beta-lactamase superfamily II) n=1 Tax=Ruminiclostridium sufflavum DSM 19573 TaxID=1121337 RepID=A0A318XPZ7_9FIRM|nr:MBL fold metallo-hydrolase [Ruminiclostridium sufflavum]PYG87835.1 glyoxylase-like metal-dependent hydrolase (beta-lactamase superfamily II) [Ruminiclostridium sufflavum DSM 19573]